MRATKLILLLGLLIFNACRSKDPQANLLPGAWKLIGTKSVTETDWKRYESSSAADVIFWEYGIMSTSEGMLFSGGWCNKAERYEARDGKIRFTFGEPTCIPLVAPQIPDEATIVDITPQSLILEWGNRMLKFERPGA
ncbi:hypothetical protein GCM10028819_08590 [Spirosoma humi]